MGAKKTKIVHIVATAGGWGGLERSAVETVTALARRGFDLVLIGSEDVCNRLPEDIPSIAFDFKGSRRSPLLLWRFTRLIRSIRPDILHLQANKAASLGKFARRFVPGMKTVATIHNTKKSVGAFTGHDGLIAVSRKAGASLEGLDHTVIWNAIPDPEPGAAPGDLPEKSSGRFAVAAYGRFVRAKGFDVLLEAIAPLADVDLWLVGDGDLMPEIKQQISELALDKRVWLPGFRRDAELIASAADLFVLPSRHEGFPFTLVEMLRRRMPVLACKVAGAEEILPPECLVEIGDVEGLREKIVWAKSKPAELSEAMAPVFDTAAERLNMDAYCDQLSAVYDSL